jgi:very-short-patch-repair endonuclease
MWAEMKRLDIWAERQFFIEHEGRAYFLDFAVFCRNGKIDVETDGDRWHSDPDRIPEDNRRNNAMASLGYQVLRFNTVQVREQMAEYCVPELVRTVKRLGGLAESSRKHIPTKSGFEQQFRLFDDKA